MKTITIESILESLSPRPEKTVGLSTVGGMLRAIAAPQVRQDGYYTCTMSGVRTLVVPDEMILSEEASR